MAKKPENHSTPRTTHDIKRMEKLANKNTPTGLIAYNLGRTPAAVRSQESNMGVSLKPVNKSPYNRRK